jgi:hypothetical protein
MMRITIMGFTIELTSSWAFESIDTFSWMAGPEKLRREFFLWNASEIEIP